MTYGQMSVQSDDEVLRTRAARLAQPATDGRERSTVPLLRFAIAGHRFGIEVDQLAGPGDGSPLPAAARDGLRDGGGVGLVGQVQEGRCEGVLGKIAQERPGRVLAARIHAALHAGAGRPTMEREES